MLTEVPYGTERALVEEYSRRSAARMDVYRAVPSDRVWVGAASWLWPCPQCRYPMVLRGGQLRCEYPPHQSRFGLVPGSGNRGGPPVLTGGRGRLATAAESAEGVLCLDWGCGGTSPVPG